jgi:Icc-related predicted phosphoesterase
VKLLLCSDLHCDTAAAARLVKLASTVNVFVAAGDFANVRRGLSKTIDVLRDITCPAVLVAGNAETTEELTAACRGWQSAHVLHGTGVTMDGVPFFGLGGAVPVTPFGSWSYDLTEADAARLLADCPPGGVLVSHSPPKGAVDRDSGGRSLGSTAVRDVIQRVRPRLVVCGHIHGSAGKEEMLGSTAVVNAGPQGIVRPIVAADAGV